MNTERKTVRVLLAAAAANKLVGGGATIQLQQTAKHLGDYGVSADFFSPWEQYDPADIDLVHVFGAYMANYDLVLRLKDLGFKVAVSPVFYTMRSHAFVRWTRKLEALANRPFSGIWSNYGIAAQICRAADMILPNTTAEAKLFAGGMGVQSDKIRVIPNGVEERFYTAEPDLFQQEFGSEKFVLCVAHMTSGRKNVLSFIRAMADVDCNAVVVGKVFDNDYGHQCLRAADDNPRLRIINGLPHDSPLLASAYAACEVFALPSILETPGIAALEAALAGAKIVITPHGGTRDYFGDMAFYPDPYRIESIAGSITAALAAKPSKALRDRVYQEYLWPRVAQKTAAAYRELLSGSFG